MQGNNTNYQTSQNIHGCNRHPRARADRNN